MAVPIVAAGARPFRAAPLRAHMTYSGGVRVWGRAASRPTAAPLLSLGVHVPMLATRAGQF